MGGFVEGLPAWATAIILFLFFASVMLVARTIAARRCSEKSAEKLSDESVRLLTGLAATFAFFVGFAITVTWGAVSAGQAAVEREAGAVRNMNWAINNIPNKEEGAQLKARLATFTEAKKRNRMMAVAQAGSPSTKPPIRLKLRLGPDR